MIFIITSSQHHIIPPSNTVALIYIEICIQSYGVYSTVRVRSNEWHILCSATKLPSGMHEYNFECIPTNSCVQICTPPNLHTIIILHACVLPRAYASIGVVLNANFQPHPRKNVPLYCTLALVRLFPAFLYYWFRDAAHASDRADCSPLVF